MNVCAGRDSRQPPTRRAMAACACFATAQKTCEGREQSAEDSDMAWPEWPVPKFAHNQSIQTHTQTDVPL